MGFQFLYLQDTKKRVPKKKLGGKPAPGRKSSTPAGQTPKTVTIRRPKSGVIKKKGAPARQPMVVDSKKITTTAGGASKQGSKKPAPPPTGKRAASTLGTKIFVGNLVYSVSEQDIKELFSSCGSLAGYAIHFDNSGRSLGSGEVVYKHRQDAEKAMQRYNNVALDGRPMKLEMIEKVMPVPVTSRLSSGKAVVAVVTKAGGGGGSRRPGGRGPPFRRGGGGERRVRSSVVAMQE
jgi:hypothetical protein